MPPGTVEQAEIGSVFTGLHHAESFKLCKLSSQFFFSNLLLNGIVKSSHISGQIIIFHQPGFP